jgi:CheY-like chemotaxis protein
MMSQVPIVGLTAHALKGDRKRCLESGMDGHIAKPPQPGGLFETVERGGAPRTE